jgi:putative peptidoglycan lipid II flippase
MKERSFAVQLLRGASTVAALGATSLAFGFAKDVIVAATYGVGIDTDAYFAAVAIPRVFDGLSLTLLATVCVGVFVDVRERRGPDAAWRYAEHLLAAVVLVAVAISALAALLASPIMRTVTGFDESGARVAATTLALLSPTVGLAGIAAVLAAFLNASRVFAIPAALGIVVNLSIVVFMLLAPRDAGAAALAAGTDIGYLAFVLIEVAAVMRLGFRPHLTTGLRDPDVLRTMVLALPLAWGALAEQIGAVSERLFASTGPTGSLSSYIFANKLRNVPGALIGQAVGTVLYPALAARIAVADSQGARDAAVRAVRYVLIAAIPVSLVFVILAAPITRVVYERGAFEAEDTVATAAVLSALGFGVAARSLVEVLSRVFFARQETRLPALALVVAVGAQILVAAALAPSLGGVGVGLAVSLAAFAQALYLAWHLRATLVIDRGALIAAARFVAAALVFAGVVSLATRIPALATGEGVTLASALAAAAVGATLLYAVVLAMLGQPDLVELRRNLTRRAKT